jgi:hypothetical protein
VDLLGLRDCIERLDIVPFSPTELFRATTLEQQTIVIQSKLNLTLAIIFNVHRDPNGSWINLLKIKFFCEYLALENWTWSLSGL